MVSWDIYIQRNHIGHLVFYNIINYIIIILYLNYLSNNLE